MKRARDPEKVRAAIADRGLSRREVTTLAKCPEGTLGFILAGRSTDPDVARRIARTLRRPVGELFADVVSSNKRDDVEREAVA